MQVNSAVTMGAVKFAKETRNSSIAERARVDGQYAFADYSRSLILILIESPYATSQLVNYILSRSVLQYLSNYRLWQRGASHSR